jgi:pentatricopeptide repeat domain-containing protein 1
MRGSAAALSLPLLRRFEKLIGEIKVRSLSAKFGDKSLQVQLAEKTIPDDSDGYDKVEFDIVPRKNAYYYKYEIPKYARQGATGLRKALELFQEMKSKDRLEPTSGNFSALIYGCAKAGYTKRAFDLYEESLRYKRKPTKSVVTCLINACAESPFPQYGLERLRWFMKHIKVEYNMELNEIQYNSAIKAFGKLGQLEEASRLVQEMLDNNVMPTVDTFNMLLIGCASDKQAGCAIALRVFKRLKMYNFKPTVVTYRLFLRCIRDCELGSAELLEETFRELPAMITFEQRLKYNKRESKKKAAKSNITSDFEWLPLISDMGRSIKTATSAPQNNCDKSLQVINDSSRPLPVDKGESLIESGSSEVSSVRDPDDKLVVSSTSTEALPNLLSNDHLDLMFRIKSIQFDKLIKRSQRLLLFGGTRGFLETMLNDGCKPDAKTFSLLLPCLIPVRENYLEFHKLSVDLDITRDLSYYNQLIRDICDRGFMSDRQELALHFVEQMHMDNLRPNVSTFEALAGSCRTWKEASRLLNDVKNCGFVVSSPMIARLLRRALVDKNVFYLNRLLDHCVEIKFRPFKHTVEELENFRIGMNDLILRQERGETAKPRFSDKFIAEFDKFQSKLDSWLKSTQLEPEDHPWKQFKVDTGSKRDGFRAYKEYFKVMEELKDEAMKRGDSNLGNLAYKADKLLRAKA